MANRNQIGYPAVSRSITNPASKDSDILDRGSPLPFLQFIKLVRVTFEPDTIQDYYNWYLREWNKTSTLSNEDKKKVIVQIYRDFIRDLAINYTTLEEREFLSKLDYDNPIDLELAAPIFSRKIKEMVDYYNDQRDLIRNGITERKIRGSGFGLERVILENVINYITNIQDSKIFFDVESIRDNYFVDIRELYTNDYSFNIPYDENIYDAKSFDWGIDMFLKDNDTLVSELCGEISDEVRQLKEIDGLFDNVRASTRKFIGTEFYYLSTNSTGDYVVDQLFEKGSNEDKDYQNIYNPSNAATTPELFKTMESVGFFRPTNTTLHFVDGKQNTFEVDEPSLLESDKIYYFPNPNITGNSNPVMTFFFDINFVKKNNSSGISSNEPVLTQQDISYHSYTSNISPEARKFLDDQFNLGAVKDSKFDIYGNMFSLIGESDDFKRTFVIDGDITKSLILDGWRFWDTPYSEYELFDYTTEDKSTYTELIRSGIESQTNGFSPLADGHYTLNFLSFLDDNSSIQPKEPVLLTNSVILEGSGFTTVNGDPLVEEISSDDSPEYEDRPVLDRKVLQLNRSSVNRAENDFSESPSIKYIRWVGVVNGGGCLFSLGSARRYNYTYIDVDGLSGTIRLNDNIASLPTPIGQFLDILVEYDLSGNAVEVSHNGSSVWSGSSPLGSTVDDYVFRMGSTGSNGFNPISANVGMCSVSLHNGDIYAEWGMNGTGLDSSGNDRHLTLINNPSFVVDNDLALTDYDPVNNVGYSKRAYFSSHDRVELSDRLNFAGEFSVEFSMVGFPTSYEDRYVISGGVNQNNVAVELSIGRVRFATLSNSYSWNGLPISEGSLHEYKIVRDASDLVTLWVDGASYPPQTVSGTFQVWFLANVYSPHPNPTNLILSDVNINNEVFYTGYGTDASNWVDTIGNNDGVIFGGEEMIIPPSSNNDGLDALGNPLDVWTKDPFLSNTLPEGNVYYDIVVEGGVSRVYNGITGYDYYYLRPLIDESKLPDFEINPKFGGDLVNVVEYDGDFILDRDVEDESSTTNVIEFERDYLYMPESSAETVYTVPPETDTDELFDRQSVEGRIFVKNVSDGEVYEFAEMFPNYITRYPANVVNFSYGNTVDELSGVTEIEKENGDIVRSPSAEVVDSVVEFEMYSDVILIKTANYLIIDKIEFDGSRYALRGTSPVIIREFTGPFDKLSNRYHLNGDIFYSTLSSNYDSVSGREFEAVPVIFKYDIQENRNFLVYPLSNTNTEDFELLNSETKPTKCSDMHLTFSERTNRFSLSIIYKDLNDFPNIHDYKFTIFPDVQFVKYESFTNTDSQKTSVLSLLDSDESMVNISNTSTTVSGNILII